MSAGTAVALVVVAAVVGDAHGSGALRPPPGSPDPERIVLAKTDFRSAKVAAQGYYHDKDFSSVVSYSREFDGARLGPTRFLYLDSEAEIGTSPETTRLYLAAVRKAVGTKAFARQIAAAVGADVKSKGIVKVTGVGRPRDIGVGDGSFDVLVTLRVLGFRTDLHLAAFSSDRVLGEVSAIGIPGSRVPVAAIARMAAVMAGRVPAELAPVNVVLPTVAGNAQAAQTLTASAGTWSGAAATFTYQWQRCDATGANCADIPPVCVPGGGVCASPPVTTSASYLATWRDVNSTLRVSVTATNALGSATVASAPTAVVTAAPRSLWPTNAVPPTISGDLHAGSTLTATSGSWTNNPTTYVYNWFRCDSTSTPRCLPAGGTGAPTYVVKSADLGSLLEVCVLAYNAAGGGGACSAKTGQIG